MNIPQDSLLRRHHASELRRQIAEEVGSRPTDSVLKRHYDSRLATLVADRLQGGGGAVVEEEAITTIRQIVPSDADTRPQPIPKISPRLAAEAPAPPPSPELPTPSGLFGWLRKLLGG